MTRVGFGKLDLPDEIRAAVARIALDFPARSSITFIQNPSPPGLFEVVVEAPQIGRGSGLFECGDFEAAVRYLDQVRCVLFGCKP